MKNTITLLQQQIAAKTGKLILAVYNFYASVFIRKDDFEVPNPPVQQREIVLVRKTGQGYSVLADALVLS
jgi:ATP-dependent protease Clp ATPase subunit